MTLPHVVALGELARSALDAWGLTGDLQPVLVAERENAVFRVDAGGESFAVRVHRAGYHSDAQLRSQVTWARALARDGVVETADALDTTAGEPFTVVAHPAVPEPRQVSLLRWVEGRSLSDLGGGDAAVFATLGGLMARLHEHALGWSPPVGFDALHWDADGLLGEAPAWGRFWEVDGVEPGDRAALLAFRDRARRELHAWGDAPDRFSLLHCDFLPENLLVDNDRVVLLDFDDCGFGWHLFDVATALAAAWRRPEFGLLRAAFVDGYRQVRALPDEHLARLPLFLTLRVATYAGWMHTRAETAFARQIGPAVVAAAVAAVHDYLQQPVSTPPGVGRTSGGH